MTEMAKQEVKEEIKKVEETKPSKSVFIPDMCAYVSDDDSGYDIEVTLPGVDRDTVKLKVMEFGFFVDGESDDIRYSGAYTLGCPIDVDLTKATYKNGLLKIHVPFKDEFKDALEVKIE